MGLYIAVSAFSAYVGLTKSPLGEPSKQKSFGPSKFVDNGRGFRLCVVDYVYEPMSLETGRYEEYNRAFFRGWHNRKNRKQHTTNFNTAIQSILDYRFVHHHLEVLIKVKTGLFFL